MIAWAASSLIHFYNVLDLTDGKILLKFVRVVQKHEIKLITYSDKKYFLFGPMKINMIFLIYGSVPVYTTCR